MKDWAWLALADVMKLVLACLAFYLSRDIRKRARHAISTLRAILGTVGFAIGAPAVLAAIGANVIATGDRGGFLRYYFFLLLCSVAGALWDTFQREKTPPK